MFGSGTQEGSILGGRWVCSDSHAHLLVDDGSLAAAGSSPVPPSICCSNRCSDSASTLSLSRGTSHTPDGSSRVSLRRVVLCGTHPALDWGAIGALAKSTADKNRKAQEERMGDRAHAPMLIMGFGIHPWYVPELEPSLARAATDKRPTVEYGSGAAVAAVTEKTVFHPNAYTPADLLARLEACLIAYPRAIVGEIGLDKLRGPSQAAQEYFFLEQVKLAARLGRPVSVHCVRHYGLLLELLDRGLTCTEDVPPAIVMHGFTGSCAVARSLLKLKPRKVSGGVTAGPSTTPPSVRISDRLFFGVGLHTSLTVKDFCTATLPMLLADAGKSRVLLETDRFHSAVLVDNNRSTCAVSEESMNELHTVNGMLSPVLEAVAAALPPAKVAEPSPSFGVTSPAVAITDDARERAARALEGAFDRAFASILLT